MFVICSLLIIIKTDGIPILIKQDTRGKIINENKTKYLVDFSEGVKNYKLVDTPDFYKNIVIDKQECVKVNK